MKNAGAILALVLVAAGARSADAQNWKDSLKAELTSALPLSRTSGDRLRITKPGVILEVKKDGIGAGVAKDMTVLKNHFRNGHVEQASGLGAALAGKKTNKDYRLGEKVYVTDVDVNDNDVQVQLLSVETSPVTIDGSTQQTRYKAVVQFDFPKGTLRSMSASAVTAVIASVMAPEGTEQPKTIEVGQSVADVEAIMGKPTSVLKVGAKVIYVYKDIKVTFVDGKVSDIQ